MAGLKVGKNGEAEGMTEAIEAAFQERWASYQRAKNLPEDLPQIGEEERRMIFSAIAEGVIRHLRDHLSEAVRMSVTVSQVAENEAGHPIVSKNDDRQVPVKYSGVNYYIETNDVLVRQTSDPVKSRGAPVIDSIEVEDL